MASGAFTRPYLIMKPSNLSFFTILAATGWMCVAGVGALDAQTAAPVGPGSTLVHSQFGGQIFGFDIDQNGTEGVLSEAQDIAGGKVLAAVETFDQATGKILKVVRKIETKDDFLTLGIAATSVGLVEREHVKGIYVVKRIYDVLNPLTSNKFNSTWTPPLAIDDIITGASRNQTSTTAAVLAFENSGDDHTFVFGSNIGPTPPDLLLL
jgi:hypothetical protein